MRKEAVKTLTALAVKSPAGGKRLPMENIPAEGHLAVWGVLYGCETILKQAMATDRSFYYVDRAYLCRGNTGSGVVRYRVTHNRLQAGAIVTRPADRWHELGIRLQTRPRGKRIIICPPTQYMCDFYGDAAKNWLAETLTTLNRHTKRPIVIREKPRQGTKGIPLATELEDAWALVTFNSNAAVEAAIAGVPVYTTEHSAARPISIPTLQQIEEPWFPDLKQWCYHLAYAQFTYQEIKTGAVWRYL